jgi:hypothetical protein
VSKFKEISSSNLNERTIKTGVLAIDVMFDMSTLQSQSYTRQICIPTDIHEAILYAYGMPGYPI